MPTDKNFNEIEDKNDGEKKKSRNYNFTRQQNNTTKRALRTST
jgi:hypothetical protein